MPGETIVLRPTDGDALTIDGATLRVGMDADWGEQTITPSLAEGPDVTGAVLGTRTREPRQATLPIQIKGTTAATYVAAAETLQTAASLLALRGGTVTRQVDFGGGNESEELEAEVLGCDLDPEEGWMQAHQTFSTVTLHLTLQPYWLADETTLETVSASVASTIEVAVSPAPRGTVPGPARLVLADNATTARRFVEIGGQFYEDVDGTYEWNASNFSLTGTSGTLVVDANAIDGHAVQVTGLVGVWQTAALLEDQALTGSYRARIRVLGGSDNASAVFRVLWRAGSGSWTEIDSVTLNATSYYDVDVGSLLNYTEATTIDVRIDVRGTDTDSSSNPKLDTLTLFPSELYAVARGVPVEGVVSGVSIFDDFQHDYASALGGTVAPLAPAGLGTWTESGDASPDWTISLVPSGKTGSGNTVTRQITTADTNITSGQFQTLGATTITDCTVTAESVSVTNASTSSTKETRGGIVARYVNTTNWLMAVVRKKRQSSGYLNETALYKSVAGSVTKLDSFFPPAGTPLYLSVTAAGVVRWGLSGYRVLAADSDLAGAGALNDGKVGIYAAADHASTATVTLAGFSSTANAPTTSNVDVVRSAGLGELTSEGAWSTASDGTAPIPVSVYEGQRLWIPPSEGRLLVKPRSSDSDAEADTGAKASTTVTLYHRPAFSTLSDTLT